MRGLGKGLALVGTGQVEHCDHWSLFICVDEVILWAP